MIIHIMGASGSGTSTIGEYLSKKLGFDIIESDFYKWKQTIPEFQVMRPIEESNRLLLAKINGAKNLIITGSLHSNPDTFKYIDLILYLKCPTKVRIKRILQRDEEKGRFSLKQEGKVKENFIFFLNLAKNYNKLGKDIRSKASQKMVIDSSNAPVIVIKTNKNIDKLHNQIIKKTMRYIYN